MDRGSSSNASAVLAIAVGAAITGVAIAGALAGWGQATTIETSTGPATSARSAGTATPSVPPSSSGSASSASGTSSPDATVPAGPAGSERPAPTTSTTSTTAGSGTADTTVGPATETPAGFLDALADAFRTGDATFLLARLHPAVVTRYGEGPCRAFAESRSDPTMAFGVTTVHEPDTYVWKTDAMTTNVPDTVAVDVDYTAKGETKPAVVHLAKAGGTWRWFADCTPDADAP